MSLEGMRLESLPLEPQPDQDAQDAARGGGSPMSG